MEIKSVREQVGELVSRQGEVEQEIQELTGKLRQARWKKRDVEYKMIELLAEEGFYYLLKVNQKMLHKFIMNEEMTL